MVNRIKIALSFFVLAGLCWQGCDTAGDFDRPDVDYFVKYYGSSHANQSGVDIVANADGTFTLVGTSETGATSRTYFVKVDGLGNVLVEKYLSGPTDVVKDVEALPDGRLLILSEFVESAGNIDLKLLRVTSDGVRVDSVTYGTTEIDPNDGLLKINDHPKRIKILKSGKIVVSGSTDNVKDNTSQNPDLADNMCVAFNQDLTPDTNWEFNLFDFPGDPDYDVIANVVEGKYGTDDAVFAIGFTTSTLGGNVNKDMVLAYIGLYKDNGGYMGARTVPSLVPGTDVQISEVIEDTSINGGFFFVGNLLLGNGRTEVFFGRFRSTLTLEPDQDVQFMKRLVPPGANNPVGVSVCKSNAGPEGYIIVSTDTKTSGSTDMIATKVDLSGEVVWSSTFGSDQGDDSAAKVLELADGRVLIVGTTRLGDNQRKLSLIKINSSGKLLK